MSRNVLTDPFGSYPSKEIGQLNIHMELWRTRLKVKQPEKNLRYTDFDSESVCSR
ncbi:hypothetical protein MTR_3g027675 [Medicago truncatula]|uniref:Uncharacterized protein n=1 Tax=Medicago truncatula TaxID=3880 RepID=A0A072UVV4_MEDTR|nr:hypothetical protein MTR_3g027675 [Medicago truncatula]